MVGALHRSSSSSSNHSIPDRCLVKEPEAINSSNKSRAVLDPEAGSDHEIDYAHDFKAVEAEEIAPSLPFHPALVAELIPATEAEAGAGAATTDRVPLVVQMEVGTAAKGSMVAEEAEEEEELLTSPHRSRGWMEETVVAMAAEGEEEEDICPVLLLQPRPRPRLQRGDSHQAG
jgi:hypothetical protein